MATFRISPNQRIPNDPFYSPLADAIPSTSGNLVVGSGIYIDYAAGVISASGGGAGSIAVVSPITNTGSLSAPVIGILTATLTQRGAVQPGTNIDILGGVISVKNASLINSGVVQLNNTTTSTSTLQALTAAQGKYLQDQINALTLSSNISFAGTFAVQTSTITATTTAGATAGFAVGSNLPLPSIANADYFVIIVDDGVYVPPGSVTPVSCTKGDWFLSDGVSWQFLDVGASYPSATTTTAGIVRLATPAETAAGLDPTIAVTPFSLSTGFIPKADYTAKGDILVATGSSTPVALPVGADGTLLTADSACLSGVKWQSGVYIPCACITARGSLITGTAASTPTPLSLGANGQVLTVDTACATGLKWGAAPATGTVTSVLTGTGLTGGPITTNGTVALANTTVTPGSYSNATLTVDQQGRLSFAATGTAPVPLATLTAKGDLITATAANTPATLAVGTNGQVLTVDGTCSGGIKWGTPTGGTVTTVNTGTGLTGGPITATGTISLATNGVVAGTYSNPTIAIDSYGRVTTAVSGAAFVECSLYTAKGAILAGSSPNVPSVLALGANNLVLTADNTCATGLKWAAASGGSVTSVGVGTGLTGTGLVGGAIVSAGTISLPNTGVTAGAYSNADFTVDSQGRLTSASSGVASVPSGIFTGKGQVLASFGSNIPAVTPAGTNGQLLTACATCSSGVTWTSPTYIPCSIIATKGSLIAGSSSNVPVSFNPGSDGQVLVVDSTCASGLKWTSGAGSVTSVATGTGLQGGPITSSGTISLTNTGVTAGTYTFPGSLAVDAQGRITSVLNSATPVLRSDYTAKGTLLTASAASTISGLAVGTDGQILTADSTCANGLKWATGGGGAATATPLSGGIVYGCTTAAGGVTAAGYNSGGTGLGTYVTAFGQCALSCTAAAGVGLTAVGTCAMRLTNAASSNNVAIGDFALSFATTHTANTAVGSKSLCALTTGGSNTAVGSNALKATTTGAGNTAVGSGALGSNTIGSNNIAVGVNALATLSTATLNIAIGDAALNKLTTGACNIGIGLCSMLNSTTGTCNIGIGLCSLWTNVNGSCNVALGQFAGSCVFSGVNNVLLGVSSGADAMCCIVNQSNHVILGNNNTGTIIGKVAYIAVSDIRWKKVKGEVPLALPFVESLTPITYQLCDAKTGEVTDDRYRYGFSAQEILANEADPEHPIIVRTDNAEMFAVGDTMLIPALVNAIKELSGEVKNLKAELNQLKNG